MQLNKIILQNIMLDINSFKKSLLVPAHIKDIYKNEKSEEFDKELLEKKVSFSNLITKKVPETIDFSETKDSPLENNSMNELLERIQRERNNDVPMPVPVSSINVSNTNQNQNQLEVVDLNKFDISLPLFNEENISMLEKETTTNKTKILNMEDLINSFSSTATATTTENIRELSKENSNLKKFVANENNSELNLNLNIKLDFLNKQMEKVLYNQKLIMTKLSI
jgi:type III secretory pathway component EscV